NKGGSPECGPAAAAVRRAARCPRQRDPRDLLENAHRLPEKALTMRFDLIPERDSFVPRLHSQPRTQRAAFTSPEWQWPSRLHRAVRAFLSRLLRASQGSYQIAVRLANDLYPNRPQS